MLIVDLIVGAVVLGLVAWGARAGVAATLPLAGFAAGAALGAVLAPLVLPDSHEAAAELVIALPAALLAGGLAAAIVERQTALRRRRLARLERQPPINTIGGGLLGGWTGLVLMWIIGAGVVQVASLRDRIEDSTIIGGLNAVVTPPGDPDAEQDNPLDLFPIVAGDRPPIAPVVLAVIRDPQVRRADRSIVKVAVSSCAGNGTGSGWVAADGVVVTNAHVVAGSSRVSVRLHGGGPPRQATPIWYDPEVDIALLRVPTLSGTRPLELVRRPRDGTAGAILGFPRGRHAIRAVRIGRTTANLGGQIGNARDQPGFRKSVKGYLTTPFRGVSQPGNSGGPIVDTSGRVLTTVWGGRSDGSSGLGVPNRFVSAALLRAGPPVETGKCRESSSDRIG